MLSYGARNNPAVLMVHRDMVHEWSLAEAVIDTIVEHAREINAKCVKKAVLGIGELQSIDVEVFKIALDALRETSETKIEELVIELEEALLACRSCGAKWTLKDVSLLEEHREVVHFVPELLLAYVRCPTCGSPDYDVVEGRGVVIKSIEVVA